MTRPADGLRWAQRSPLTRRELEILDFVAARYTNAEIAAALTISKRTVESHVSALRRKLGAADRPTLIAVGSHLTVGLAVVPGPARDGRPEPREPDGAEQSVHPGPVSSGHSLEAAEAKYRLRQLAASTREARVRAAGLRSRSIARIQISMQRVSLTHVTLERTQEALAIPASIPQTSFRTPAASR
ncbi:MAG TPA: helix-turn-helix transcriptional regulator [Jatrophihabitans sp.]|nr:helix-turn-helix transcriptional regulator [Jatrophihabitans sp.]